MLKLFIIKYFGLFLALTCLIVFHFHNEIPLDIGDGIMHYSIVNNAWENPSEFLNHWGKPLFILCSAPFGKGSFFWFPFFNVLVFGLSILIVFKFFKLFNLSWKYYFFFPLLLITIPDVSNSILGGMTEPFFSFLLLSAVYFLYTEKYLFFAIIISFMPFARSEGMLCVILAFFFLVYLKKWKEIPLLFLGYLIYSIAGHFILNDFNWYFNTDPYPSKSIYGSGSLFEYIITWRSHFGLILVCILPLSVLGLIKIIQSKNQKKLLLVILFTSTIYFGIIIVHSLLWWKGLKGALGLSRIATQGLVPFIMLLFITLAKFNSEKSKKMKQFFTLVFILLLIKKGKDLDLPKVIHPDEKCIELASVYINKNKLPHRKVYYFHGLLAYFWEINLRKKHPVFEHSYMKLNLQFPFLKPGDLIVRDSKFATLEAGLPLEELIKYPQLVPVKHFYSAFAFPEFNGERRGIIIYEMLGKETVKKLVRKEKFIEVDNLKWKNLKTKKEFIDLIPILKVPKGNFFSAELQVNFTIEKSKEATVYLVFDNQKGTYISKELKNNENSISFPFISSVASGKLYVYNQKKDKIVLTIKQGKWFLKNDFGIIKKGIE